MAARACHSLVVAAPAERRVPHPRGGAGIQACGGERRHSSRGADADARLQARGRGRRGSADGHSTGHRNQHGGDRALRLQKGVPDLAGTRVGWTAADPAVRILEPAGSIGTTFEGSINGGRNYSHEILKAAGRPPLRTSSSSQGPTSFTDRARSTCRIHAWTRGHSCPRPSTKTLRRASCKTGRRRSEDR